MPWDPEPAWGAPGGTRRAAQVPEKSSKRPVGTFAPVAAWGPHVLLRSLSAEQTWPGTHETLLTTWKIVAFTATSVLLVLLLVILARMFQTKFKAHFPPRSVLAAAARYGLRAAAVSAERRPSMRAG